VSHFHAAFAAHAEAAKAYNGLAAEVKNQQGLVDDLEAKVEAATEEASRLALAKRLAKAQAQLSKAETRMDKAEKEKDEAKTRMEAAEKAAKLLPGFGIC
jgi:regulator of replication initiation timing